MDILVQSITQANEAYRNGKTLLMTDEEYDAAVDLLSSKVPNHPLLKKIRSPPNSTNGLIVKMPYYLGSLDKAKVSEELAKWLSKSAAGSKYVISEKLDGISGLWNPCEKKLYLSGDDNTGVDVSSWLKYISLSQTTYSSDIPEDVWIRGELIMSKDMVPVGRLGRSIINGIFHHKVPNPLEAAKVRFVGYEVMGMDPSLSVQQQMAWLQNWKIWVPWSLAVKDLPAGNALTELLTKRRLESIYEMDGLVIKMNIPVVPRVQKGNPKDAIAWKPPNGEAKMTVVVQVEWNASATGKLVPRVEIKPVHIGGSTITYVSGVNARRIVDWNIGPGATVVIRKGGDVIPVIDRVEVPAVVTFPPEGTWEWDGNSVDASNIKQKSADSTTIVAQYMKMVTRLGWENVGPAQMKSVVDAGYTTIPILRNVPQVKLIELLGPVKGAHLYKLLQADGWTKATEIDLFVASPICPSGIGKTRLDALTVIESDVTRWSNSTLVAPKGWSADALKEFQGTWTIYEDFRKNQWSFIPYPVAPVKISDTSLPVATIGSIVFTGFRDADLEAKLLAKGYKVVDTVKSDTKAVLIADKEDPNTYTSTKIDKAKNIPGCVILRKADWVKI
jgi:NAD-dependent DNA ligase